MIIIYFIIYDICYKYINQTCGPIVSHLASMRSAPARYSSWMLWMMLILSSPMWSSPSTFFGNPKSLTFSISCITTLINAAFWFRSNLDLSFWMKDDRLLQKVQQHWYLWVTWTVLPVSGVMPSMVRMISKVCSAMSLALILYRGDWQ